jgi:hypothetical protein
VPVGERQRLCRRVAARAQSPAPPRGKVSGIPASAGGEKRMDGRVRCGLNLPDVARLIGAAALEGRCGGAAAPAKLGGPGQRTSR